MNRLLAKIHHSVRRTPMAWLTVMLAGCMSMSPRPFSTARPPADTMPPAVAQAPRTIDPPAATRMPPAAQKPKAAERTIPPAEAEKRTVQRPPSGSQLFPKSNAPGNASTDPDEPPQAVTRDNRLPKVEPLPKIAPDEVTVPQLIELSVIGPLKKQIGASGTFQITIRNAGDRPQEDLIVRCRFDDALVFPGSEKREVVRRLDRLGPGESRDMALTLSSSIVGAHCCWFTVARLEGNEEIEVTSRQVCIDYVVRQVDIEITGPSQRTEGSRAEFNVSLCNSSPKQISETQIVVSFDKALVPKELSSGAEQRPGQLVWNLGSLEPEEKIRLQTEFECRTQAHRACVTVEVKGANHSGDVDEACLEIVPVTGTLDLRISDTDDPLVVGQTGTYLVTVENIGLQAVRRVTLEATASENVKIRSAVVRTAGNDVPLKHKLEGDKLLFDALEQLDPGAHLVYTIEVEALRPGAAELRASLTSGLSRTPVTTTEPTSIVAPDK